MVEIEFELTKAELAHIEKYFLDIANYVKALESNSNESEKEKLKEFYENSINEFRNTFILETEPYDEFTKIFNGLNDKMSIISNSFTKLFSKSNDVGSIISESVKGAFSGVKDATNQAKFEKIEDELEELKKENLILKKTIEGLVNKMEK